MKTKIKNCLVVLMLIGASGFAQNYISVGNMDAIKVEGNSFNLDGKVKGSAYVTEGYQPAKMAGRDVIYGARYNAYNDEMEIEVDGQGFNLKKTIKSPIVFESSNKKYDVYVYKSLGKSSVGYFVVTAEGAKLNLLTKEKITLTKEVKPKSNFDKYKPAKFQRSKDVFYIGSKDNKATLMPGKKKDFYKLFNDQSGAIEAYVKKNKLNIKKQKDLIKIFNYYNL